MISKTKKDRNLEINPAMDECTFEPEINPKTDEILQRSSLPSEFMKRQRVNKALSQKKMRDLREMYSNSYKPTFVAKYNKKIEVN